MFDLGGWIRVWTLLLSVNVPPVSASIQSTGQMSVHYSAEADVGVNCDSAPPRQWKPYLEKKVVRMSHVYLSFSERMKKKEEEKTRRSHYPESCGPRKAWKLGFVPRRRKSEGDIFLTWMFLNLVSKQRGSQRAVCLSLAKHNIIQPCRPSHSMPVPVNRATIRGGRAGLQQLVPVMGMWGILVFCWWHVTYTDIFNLVLLRFHCFIVTFSGKRGFSDSHSVFCLFAGLKSN